MQELVTKTSGSNVSDVQELLHELTSQLLNYLFLLQLVNQPMDIENMEEMIINRLWDI